MKKRLKGLLAFWLCMLILYGSSMSVMAAEYSFENIKPGDIFVGGDVIKELIVSGGDVYYVDLDQSEAITSPYNIKTGTWEYIGQEYGGCWYPMVFKAVETGSNVTNVSGTSYSCDHDMQYEIYCEPTEEVDGLWRYGCTKCTHTEGFVTICGMGAFLERAINTINGAEVNGTVTIATPKWMSFNKDVYDALAVRPDVTVNVHFRYQGQFYAVTIPAGTDMTPYLTEDGYCGFLKLAALFGVTAIQTEE